MHWNGGFFASKMAETVFYRLLGSGVAPASMLDWWIEAKSTNCTRNDGQENRMQTSILKQCSRLTVLMCLHTACQATLVAYDGQLTVSVSDEESGEPMPVRMELLNSRGRPVRVRPPGAILRDGYMVFDSEVVLELKKGSYRFQLDAGPEFQTRQGHFTIERHAEDNSDVSLRRHVDMAEEGWWAGDLDVQHRAVDLPLLKRAAGVSFVPPTVSQNIRGKSKKLRKRKGDGSGPVAALDYRRGGGLMVLADSPELIDALELSNLKDEDSSGAVFDNGQDGDVDLVALTPYAWDLPLWVATDRLTAIQTMHRQTWPDGKHPNEGWGRPRDKDVFPGRQGNGQYSEVIYHHLLNCGLRIPPAAGSGSGANGSPLGLNRVYVDCGDEYSEQRWFEGLRAGHVLVTNGPLLRVSVEGKTPGHVFHLDRDDRREFQIALSLSFYQKAPVEYLEIVKNGQVEYEIRLSDLVKKKGKLPPVVFEQSGWFLVRAVTSSTETYQYASTGPYYVESEYRPRVSRASVAYFLEWLDEAQKKFAGNEQVASEIEAARPFWENLKSQANAD